MRTVPNNPKMPVISFVEGLTLGVYVGIALYHYARRSQSVIPLDEDCGCPDEPETESPEDGE